MKLIKQKFCHFCQKKRLQTIKKPPSFFPKIVSFDFEIANTLSAEKDEKQKILIWRVALNLYRTNEAKLANEKDKIKVLIEKDKPVQLSDLFTTSILNELILFVVTDRFRKTENGILWMFSITRRSLHQFLKCRFDVRGCHEIQLERRHSQKGL